MFVDICLLVMAGLTVLFLLYVLADHVFRVKRGKASTIWTNKNGDRYAVYISHSCGYAKYASGLTLEEAKREKAKLEKMENKIIRIEREYDD